MLDKLSLWLQIRWLPRPDDVARDLELLSAALVAYAQCLYDAKAPCPWGSETLVGAHFRWP
eukprot:5434450-Pyramimonas_sp.AAC.1